MTLINNSFRHVGLHLQRYNAHFRDIRLNTNVFKSVLKLSLARLQPPSRVLESDVTSGIFLDFTAVI